MTIENFINYLNIGIAPKHQMVLDKRESHINYSMCSFVVGEHPFRTTGKKWTKDSTNTIRLFHIQVHQQTRLLFHRH